MINSPIARMHLRMHLLYLQTIYQLEIREIDVTACCDCDSPRLTYPEQVEGVPLYKWSLSQIKLKQQ